MEHDPLELDADTMRKLGYQTIDWLVDRATRRRDEPVLRQLSPSEMASQVDGGAPAKGQELSAVLDQLASDVLPFRSRIDHPRYLAYVPGEGTWPGALGDLVASAYNIDAGNWMESAGPVISKYWCCGGSPNGSAIPPPREVCWCRVARRRT